MFFLGRAKHCVLIPACALLSASFFLPPFFSSSSFSRFPALSGGKHRARPQHLGPSVAGTIRVLWFSSRSSGQYDAQSTEQRGNSIYREVQGPWIKGSESLREIACTVRLGEKPLHTRGKNRKNILSFYGSLSVAQNQKPDPTGSLSVSPALVCNDAPAPGASCPWTAGRFPSARERSSSEGK